MKRILLLLILTTFISCADNVPPSCVITSPVLDEVLQPGEKITIIVDASDSDGSIREVKILVDDNEIAVLEDAPFEYELDTRDYEIGSHQIEAIAIDNNRDESSDELSFVIGSLPAVGTGIAKTVGVDSAIVNVTIYSGSSPMEAGIYWGPTVNTESTGTQVKFETGTGSFSLLIRSLTPGTKYYYRAFAENDFGLAYGDEKSFTTLILSIPEVTTAPAVNIEYSSASSGGAIASDGQGSIFEKGVCWSIAPLPTINDARTNEGSGTDPYFSQMTDLIANTKYYIRAYASNEVGTAYGNEEEFTTADYELPKVNTRDITEITQTDATSGGYITNNGGQEITERGVCWSTSPSPTTTDQKLADATTGSGNYISAITGLEQGTYYYLRAYAINSIGTGYGTEITFSTIGTPSVVTAVPSNVSPTGATVGGDIKADGGADITRMGVYVGTTDDPENTGINYIYSTPGTGEYSINLSSLSTGVTYYVVAYATNDYGTAYGEVLEFIPQ